MTLTARAGALSLGVSTQGLGLQLQRGGLLVGVERTWSGQTRAGLYYQAHF